ARPHRARVAPAVRLRQAEATDRVAARQPWQPLRLLLVGTERVDRVHREGALDGDERTEPRVAGLELQLDQAAGDRAEVTDPRQLHPEEPELPELLRQLASRELRSE